MYSRHHRRYQEQAIQTATPEQLILKLYDLGIASCRNGDRSKLRAVLVELISSLNFEAGGELANRLYAIYEFCLNESAMGDLEPIQDMLQGLRDAWKEGVVEKQPASV